MAPTEHLHAVMISEESYKSSENLDHTNRETDDMTKFTAIRCSAAVGYECDNAETRPMLIPCTRGNIRQRKSNCDPVLTL